MKEYLKINPTFALQVALSLFRLDGREESPDTIAQHSG